MKRLFWPEIRPTRKEIKPQIKTVYPDRQYSFNEVFNRNKWQQQ